MASESIAELPDKIAAIILVAAIARLPTIAAKIANFDSLVMVHTITKEARGLELLEQKPFGDLGTGAV